MVKNSDIVVGGVGIYLLYKLLSKKPPSNGGGNGNGNGNGGGDVLPIEFTIDVSPSSGSSPLTAQVAASIKNVKTPLQNFYILYGDGSTGTRNTLSTHTFTSNNPNGDIYTVQGYLVDALGREKTATFDVYVLGTGDYYQAASRAAQRDQNLPVQEASYNPYANVL